MLTRNFTKLQAKVQRHVEADQVAQGSYKTGFIGCLAGGENDPEFIEREYGIPKAVSRIAVSIFEGLPPGEAASFFAALPSAIECDGKDLSLVGWQFLAAELRSLPPATPEVQAVIAPVIDGIDLLAQGKEWPEEDAEAASKASAAYAAATTSASARTTTSAAAYAGCAASAYASATTSAVYGARAAEAIADATAAAAYAAYVIRARQATALAGGDPILAPRRQRNTLLKLIKEAPITTQENN
jgi:hypothetical protein